MTAPWVSGFNPATLANMPPGWLDILYGEDTELRNVIEQAIAQNLPPGLESPSGVIGTGPAPTLQDLQMLGVTNPALWEPFLAGQVEVPPPITPATETRPPLDVSAAPGGGDGGSAPAPFRSAKESAQEAVTTHGAGVRRSVPAVGPLPGSDEELLDMVSQLARLRPRQVFEIPMPIQRLLDKYQAGELFARLMSRLGFLAMGDIGLFGFNTDWMIPATFGLTPEALAMLAELDSKTRVLFELLLTQLLGVPMPIGASEETGTPPPEGGEAPEEEMSSEIIPTPPPAE